MKEDDPAHASLRTAESVVALARAEARLVLLEAKTAAKRLAISAALGAVAGFLWMIALVVVVLMPVLWAFRPAAALGTLGIALGLALVTSLVTLVRARRQRAPKADEASHPPPLAVLRGPGHARK